MPQLLKLKFLKGAAATFGGKMQNELF